MRLPKCKRPAPPTKAEGEKLGEDLRDALGDVGNNPPKTRANDIIEQAKGKKRK